MLKMLGRNSKQPNGAHANRLARIEKGIAGNQAILDKILQVLVRIDKVAQSQLYAQAYPLISEIESFYEKNQLTFAETLETIQRDRVSLARFGDGEMRAMLAPDHALKFQKGSEEMSRDLRDVFTLTGYENVPLMIGLPHLFRGHAHWTRVWMDVWRRVRPLLSSDRKYGNAHVTRPVCFQSGHDKAVERWRRLWNGKNVTVITGKGSRFDLEPALFDCVASVRYVFSTPTEAYSDIDRLIGEVLRTVSKDTVCLIALGPAGTIIAAKLAREGYWALDIGHLSASYAAIYKGAPNPEHVPLERDGVHD